MKKLPSKVDLRHSMPEVMDQGGLGSSAALTIVAALDYLEKRTMVEEELDQYEGHRKGLNLTVSRRTVRLGAKSVYELPLRLDLRNHSPDGFAWGYMGSGPAQASLAILADLVGDMRATRNYQKFKEDIIGLLPMDADWVLSARTIREWLKGVEEQP